MAPKLKRHPPWKGWSVPYGSNRLSAPRKPGAKQGCLMREAGGDINRIPSTTRPCACQKFDPMGFFAESRYFRLLPMALGNGATAKARPIVRCLDCRHQSSPTPLTWPNAVAPGTVPDWHAWLVMLAMREPVCPYCRHRHSAIVTGGEGEPVQRGASEAIQAARRLRRDRASL